MIKFQKIKIVLILVGIIFVLAIGINKGFDITQGSNIRNRAKEINETKLKMAKYWVTGPIYIDDDDPINNWENTEAAYGWCSGSGTLGDPYIIKNVIINGLGLGICIYIANSDVSFRIENCILTNASYGIALNKTSNGMFFGNTIYHNNLNGIYFSKSEHHIVGFNTVYNNNITGISLHLSNNTLIVNNTIFGSDYGIDNNGNHNDIYINFINNTNLAGIRLKNSMDTEISGNYIYNNTNYGVGVAKSHYNVISYNIINNNTIGINLYQAESNTISCNSITYNRFYGVNLDDWTHFNRIFWNNFIGNCYNPPFPTASQAFDHETTSSNFFYDNYWDDWDGSGWYLIDGPSGSSTNQDSSPLSRPKDINKCSPSKDLVIGSPLLCLLVISLIACIYIAIYISMRKKLHLG